MNNFWRSLDFKLINCEIELDLKWTKNCVISEISRIFRAVDPNANPVVYELATTTTGAIFQINNAKLYVPVVTLSINDNIKFLDNIKQGLKKMSWNKYGSEITTQTKKNNLDYLIDLIFSNINRLFLLSLKNDEDGPTRYYMPLVDILKHSLTMDHFLINIVKSKQEAYEKPIEM